MSLTYGDLSRGDVLVYNGRTSDDHDSSLVLVISSTLRESGTVAIDYVYVDALDPSRLLRDVSCRSPGDPVWEGWYRLT